jgi:hypothetical protein
VLRRGKGTLAELPIAIFRLAPQKLQKIGLMGTPWRTEKTDNFHATRQVIPFGDLLTIYLIGQDQDVTGSRNFVRSVFQLRTTQGTE